MGKSKERDGLEMKVKIVKVIRTETKGSKSPMWRMMSADGTFVNVFRHAIAERNSFAHFERSGHAEYLWSMGVGEIELWETTPIEAEIEKEGEWWAVKSVTTIGDADHPDSVTISRPEEGTTDTLSSIIERIKDKLTEMGRDLEKLGALVNWSIVVPPSVTVTANELRNTSFGEDND